ncbi:hypothetical protein E6O75_ATG00386 [Venturia nashicola]|uniref:Uncharacterized protein n=1 Tax=Venturia nashicola TaxID=86259 RepID=A0A4Z1PN66_9PEZI|nr:hypothetical protein E6O75_ATG00386 [Venturia nashicola]
MDVYLHVYLHVSPLCHQSQGHKVENYQVGCKVVPYLDLQYNTPTAARSPRAWDSTLAFSWYRQTGFGAAEGGEMDEDDREDHPIVFANQNSKATFCEYELQHRAGTATDMSLDVLLSSSFQFSVRGQHFIRGDSTASAYFSFIHNSLLKRQSHRSLNAGNSNVEVEMRSPTSLPIKYPEI